VTLGKQKYYLTVHHAHAITTKNKKILPRLSFLALRRLFPEWQYMVLEEKAGYPECPHSGKGLFPQGAEGTRGRIFLFFSPIFCEALPHYLKLFIQILDNFDFFIYFVIFLFS
jgi:hypothetical protein